MTGYLTRKQVEYLLQPIRANRVNSRDGMAYVEGHDIKAELIRVFGFARWSWVIRESVIEHKEATKTKAGKDAWYVVARTVGDLTVCAPDGTVLATYSGAHVGESTHPVLGEAMGNALTNSDTYATKRAAICALADAGGLGLYNKGSREALVRGTFVMPEPDESEPVELPETPEVHPESLERPGMPPKDVQTNGNAEDDGAQERAVAAILAALEQREGEQPRAYLSRVTKAQIDTNRYGLAEHEVSGEPLAVIVGNALADATAAMS